MTLLHLQEEQPYDALCNAAGHGCELFIHSLVEIMRTIENLKLCGFSMFETVPIPIAYSRNDLDLAAYNKFDKTLVLGNVKFGDGEWMNFDLQSFMVTNIVAAIQHHLDDIKTLVLPQILPSWLFTKSHQACLTNEVMRKSALDKCESSFA